MLSKEHRFYKDAIHNMLPEQDEVRRKILRQMSSDHTQKLRRWLIPVVACVTVAVVICTAISPVRAAISQWFTESLSLGSYLMQPEDERTPVPELEVIIKQTKPETIESETHVEAEPVGTIEIVNVVPEWKKWADGLNPTVGDVFYDGEKLIVPFDLGGGGEAFGILGSKQPVREVSMGNPGYIYLNGSKYSYDLSCMLDTVPNNEGNVIQESDSLIFVASIDLSRPTDYTVGFDGLTEEEQALWLEQIKEVQEIDPEYTPFEFQTLGEEQELTGIQKVEANIPLIMHDYSNPSEVDEQGTTYEGIHIGMLKLRFRFNAGQRVKSQYQINQTVEFVGEGTYKWADWDSDPTYMTCTNKTIDMSGVKMTAKQIKMNPLGAELYVSITCPDSWDELDKQCFVSSLIPCTKGDGIKLPSSGEQYGLEEDGEDLGMCIYLDMLPSELESIDTFEIVPVLSRYTGYDDIPYVEGKLTRIKKDEVQGWQEDSKELTDCALQFSIK